MPSKNFVSWKTWNVSTTSNTSSTSGYIYADTNMAYDEAYKSGEFVERVLNEKPENTEIKDEVIKILTSGYFVHNNVVWFMNRKKSTYNDKVINSLHRQYDLLPFVFDPINDEHGNGIKVPATGNWYEALIIDCIEYCNNRMIAANAIKFAMTCLNNNSRSRLTIIVKKGLGLDKDDLFGISYMANAKSVWEQNEFDEIENIICVAAR